MIHLPGLVWYLLGCATGAILMIIFAMLSVASGVDDNLETHDDQRRS